MPKYRLERCGSNCHRRRILQAGLSTSMHTNTRYTQVRSPHGEVKLLLLACSLFFRVDNLQRLLEMYEWS